MYSSNVVIYFQKIPTMTPSELVKSLALSSGFDLVGIAKAEVIPEAQEHYFQWLEKGYHADMQWMEKDPERRSDPQKVVEGAKSIIMLAINYYQEDPKFPEGSGRIARYARGKDYHKYLEKMLKSFVQKLKEQVSATDEYRYYVDYGPFLERAYAEMSGIGFIGRNKMLITREFGSYVFLSEVITTLELTPDKPQPRLCGTCRACIDACPTKAIVEEDKVCSLKSVVCGNEKNINRKDTQPKSKITHISNFKSQTSNLPQTSDSRLQTSIDSRRCLPFHTIESKRESIPDEIVSKMGDRIFGCDICQEVCPHNIVNAKPTKHTVFTENSTAFVSASSFLKMTEEEFQEKFSNSPLKRTGLKGMQRNSQAMQSN